MTDKIFNLALKHPGKIQYFSKLLDDEKEYSYIDYLETEFGLNQEEVAKRLLVNGDGKDDLDYFEWKLSFTLKEDLDV